MKVQSPGIIWSGILVLVVLVSVFGVREAKADITSDLVSYWPLNEESGARVDSVGDNDLTDNGGVVGVDGYSGGAAVFESGDYLSRADNADLSTGGSSDFTISLWVKLEEKSGTQVFVSKYAGASGEFAVFFENSFDSFIFSTYAGGNMYFVEADSLGSPEVGVWYHLVAIHDATEGTNTIVVDGAYEEADVLEGVPQHSDTSAPFLIGAFGPAFSYPALAMIDEVKFWKRALTLAEAGDTYDSEIREESYFITSQFSDIGTSTATLTGSLFVEDIGVEEIGFVYSTSSSFTSSSTIAVDTETFEDDDYSATITGLTCDQRYFYKAYLIDENDDVIEDDVVLSFATAECESRLDDPLLDEAYEIIRQNFATSSSWTAVEASADGEVMVGTTFDMFGESPFGYVYISTDGGTTWDLKEAFEGIVFTSVVMSADGQKIALLGADINEFVFGETIMQVMVSEDAGLTWEMRSQIVNETFVEEFEGISMEILASFLFLAEIKASDDLSRIYVAFLDEVHRSTDVAETWDAVFSIDYVQVLVTSLDVTADGEKAIFTIIEEISDGDYGLIFGIVNGNWVPVAYNEGLPYISVAMSDNGRDIFAVDVAANLFVSNDEGVSWREVENPDDYGWVYVIGSEETNGMFAAALGYVDGEVGEETWLNLYYSPDGGDNWEKVDEINVTDRSGLINMLGSTLGNLAASNDLSRIAMVSLFDLYVITRGEIVEPAPPPEENSRRSTVSSTRRAVHPSSNPVTIEEFVSLYRDLFIQAHARGIVLPPTLLSFLGLSTLNTPVRDLEISMTGSDVRALQELLIREGYGIPDGPSENFGRQTQAALAIYQKDKGIVPATGYFGSMTRQFMKTSGLTGLWW